MPTIGSIAGNPRPREPKGPHGRAAVKAIGQTKTTGRFAQIARAKGKGAAIAAYQNKLAKHKGRPAPYGGR
jgi:hypothetical protein